MMKQVTLGYLTDDEQRELEEWFLPLYGLLSESEETESVVRLVRGGHQPYDRIKQMSLLRVLTNLLLTLSEQSTPEFWEKTFAGNDDAMKHKNELAEMRRVSAEKITRLIRSIGIAHLDIVPNKKMEGIQQ